MYKNEVPSMTPDIFYKFDDDSISKQLRIPNRPVKGKVFRPDYGIGKAGLEIKNGPNMFNRPLYSPGCKSFVTAGDRPAFILWTNNNYKKSEELNWGIPNLFGHCFIGLCIGNASKWFYEFENSDTVYHPGWVEYRLSDDEFPGAKIHIELVPHCTGAFFITFNLTYDKNISCDNIIMPEFIWTHGCITFEGWNCWMNSYDPQSRLIPWDQPDFAKNNSIQFIDGLAILKNSADGANWAAVGSYPDTAEMREVNAEKRLSVSPDDIFKFPGEDKPIAAGRISPEKKACSFEACIILNWGRNSDPIGIMLPLKNKWREAVVEGKNYFDSRCRSMTIATPNKELDTLFAFNAVASDSMWHPPGINHGAYSWGGLTTIFRIYYGLTCCGDHERVKSALMFHCFTDEDGRLQNVTGSPEEKPGASPYESYGSTCDMLWHHYLWTGDRETLRNWVPIIDKLLMHEESKRKDAEGLFIDHLGFWCSDSFDYERGCVVGTTFVWLMYTIRGRIADVLGEASGHYFKRAAEIKDLMYGRLWNEDEGFFHDTVMPDGEAVPSAIAPAIYHPVEYGMVEEEKADRMLDWMLERLVSPEGMVRVDDWVPINWSHNVYSPLETANAAIAAYKLRRSTDGYKMLCGIIRGAIYKAVVPGSISCHSSSTGITRNGTDFGDGVSLFLRTVVEGLFGIRMNFPGGNIDISPNFPSDWNNAEITLPDIKLLRFIRTNDGTSERVEYAVDLCVPLSLHLSMPVRGEATAVRVNGIDADYEICLRRGALYINLKTGKSAKHLITLEFDTVLQKSESKIDRTTSSVSPNNTAACKDCIRPESQNFPENYIYEQINLDGLSRIPFADIYKVFPQEMTWHLENFGKVWRCEFDGAVTDEGRMVSDGGIAFSIDGESVAAIRKERTETVWKGQKLEMDIPDSMTIRIDKPADKVYLLLSGLCSPMTCYLPQIQIMLSYDDGRNLEYKLKSPDELDFATQHTSVNPALHIGWFGKAEELEKLKNFNENSQLENDKIIATGIQQLHGDVICLEGYTGGLLKEIAVKSLKSQSGIILYGVTLAVLKK